MTATDIGAQASYVYGIITADVTLSEQAAPRPDNTGGFL
jgi:hypothetical protein